MGIEKNVVMLQKLLQLQPSGRRTSCQAGMCVQAAGHWENALRLNPLFPQGWFALGYCCLKTKNQQRALQVILKASVCQLL